MPAQFKDELAPIEVFFKNKYKGYHARGKLNLLFTRVFENPNDTDKYQGVYMLGTYALVNNEYVKTVAQADPEDKSFRFHFFGANKREYDKTVSIILRELVSAKADALSTRNLIDASSFNPSKLTAREILDNPNKPITLTSIKLTDTESIDTKIARNLPIIPTGIFLDSEYIIDRATNKVTKPFSHSSYHIFACNFAEALKHYPDGRYRIFETWLGYFYDQLAGVFGYPKITKIDFVKMAKQIADFGYAWITTKAVTRPYLDRINQLIESITETDCYLTEFCYSIFFDLINDMLTADAATECEFCELLPFEKGKKYCSLKSEGRKCGKKARNKKFYGKHRERLKKRQRIESKLDREFKNSIT
jgi:hypothetical protein